MELDVIQIGARIRKIREEDFRENRDVFAERCGVNAKHYAKLENGGFTITTRLLNKICKVTGASADYILFGKTNNEDTAIRKKIDNLLDTASLGELKAFLRVLLTIREHYDLKEDKKIR